MFILDDDFNASLGWEEELPMKAYTADFETTTDPEDCRVWAAATCEVGNVDNMWYGKTAEDFIEWCCHHPNTQLYYHNLAFDGNFLMAALERNGWCWIPEDEKPYAKTYKTIISDMNQVYAITLNITARFKVRIYDSYKIIPMGVEKVAKAYGLPIQKGSIDYEEYREPGHELTDEESEYLQYDVQIMAMAMKIMLDEGMNRMTAGSNALADYKTLMGGHRAFRKSFPIIDDEADDFIRKAYRGGFTYADPRFSGVELGVVEVFDVNSLYPSVMASSHGELLPYGKPAWFDGSPFDRKYKSTRPLWIASLTCSFKLREDHIPCIQLKGNNRFRQTEYLSNSEGEVTIAVTNVDYDLIINHYDLEIIEWNGGYSFEGANDKFIDYVTKWTEVKIQAGKEGNKGLRQLAKLMLNSLYGKFATNRTVCSRRPVLDSDGVIRYVDLEPTTREPVYLPVGVFITSYARAKTIMSAQRCYERFAYADTDSLHLVGEGVPDFLDVDDYELGKWAHECTADRAKFLRAKCYIEEVRGDDRITVHVAGMPEKCHDQVTFENFELGATYYGKLYQKKVPGGIVLEPGTITLKHTLY